MNIWMTGKILMKKHYLKKKKRFIEEMEEITDIDYMH